MSNLKNVANQAKVSIATVSRVINDDPKVAPETKTRVLKAIENLDYKPNRVAQRLRSAKGNNRLIALLIPDIKNPFYVDVISGVEDFAYKNNFVAMIGNFNQDQKKEKLYLDIYKSENVDGFIVAPVNEKDSNVVDLARKGFPLVCIDRGLSEVETDLVIVDNEAGAFNATEHLLKIGHDRIGLISGDLSIPTYKNRLKGYRKALKKYHIPYQEELVVAGNSGYQSGYELTNKLLNLKEKPSAIFTTNNLLTLGALEALTYRKINVPQEVSIVGFDDMYWSASLNPPLTAVRQPGFEIGRRAAELISQRILNPKAPPVNLTLKTQLIVRGSATSPIKEK